MSVEFPFKQSFAERCEVYRDQSPVRSPAVGMNGACHHLLAGAAFAGDQNRSIMLCGQSDSTKQMLHGQRIANQVI